MAGILKFDSVVNVRDFGGQLLVDGRQVTEQRFFRGAQISSPSVRDRTRMQEFGITLVVDFRYRSERKRQPSLFDDIFSPDVLEILPEFDLSEDTALAPHEQFMLHDLSTVEDAHRYMTKSYTERSANSAFISVASRTLKRMSQTGENIYVHCAAGKDRTGTFAAILLLLLGVSHTDMMDDYLRTREALEFNLIKNMAAKKMEERYGRPYDPDALEPFFGVDVEYMKCSLEQIGDVENYTKTILKLSDAEIASLRAHYIIDI